MAKYEKLLYQDIDTEIYSFVFEEFKLDGGAMFGAIPKNLWCKLISADEENRINLVTRSLLIKKNNRVILVDAGIGDYWDEKFNKIFAIESVRNTLTKEFQNLLANVTDIILTHLHFDHAGGIAIKLPNNLNQFLKSEEEKYTLRYPNAKIHIQKTNLDNAQNPSAREKASYNQKYIALINQTNLNTIEGYKEVFPGIIVHVSNGHTEGLQWLQIKTHNKDFIFPSDVIPTFHHLHPAYHMGYDMCAKEVLKEKEKLLRIAKESNATLIFQHGIEVDSVEKSRLG